jgi:hypothetical protein
MVEDESSAACRHSTSRTATQARIRDNHLWVHSRGKVQPYLHAILELLGCPPHKEEQQRLFDVLVAVDLGCNGSREAGVHVPFLRQCLHLSLSLGIQLIPATEATQISALSLQGNTMKKGTSRHAKRTERRLQARVDRIVKCPHHGTGESALLPTDVR